MSTADQSADDFFMSLTGFDELAVAKLFGTDITDLKEAPFRFLRALVFVDQRRTGAKDAEAYRTAMEMSVAGVSDYFPDAEPADVDPDAPDSDTGKGGSPSV